MDPMVSWGIGSKMKHTFATFDVLVELLLQIRLPINTDLVRLCRKLPARAATQRPKTPTMRYQYACASPMLSAWNMPVPMPIPLILILIPDMSILAVFKKEAAALGR